MNSDKEERDKKEREDQGSSMDEGVDANPKDKDVATQKSGSKTKYKYEDKRPEWCMVGVTSLLVVITLLYTFAAWKQNELTRDTLDAALDMADLEQRPWLGYYGYAIEARRNPVARWEKREPEAGEEFRVRCFIQNVGKTPALNIKTMSITPHLIPIGDFYEKPDDWIDRHSRLVLFPNDRGLSHIGEGFSLDAEGYGEYLSRRKYIFFWAKLYYCDFAGRRHWTEVAVSHVFGSDEFRERSSSVNTVSGETRHPDCRD